MEKKNLFRKSHEEKNGILNFKFIFQF
jgi:hypothetical protein